MSAILRSLYASLQNRLEDTEYSKAAHASAQVEEADSADKASGTDLAFYVIRKACSSASL